MEPDFWRQLDIFAPEKFKTPITVIGAGATGSYAVWLLAKMGCKDITVYDFDDIENHNLPNQIYGLNSVGQKKVDALQKMIKNETGIEIKVKPERFTEGELKGIVFVLPDSMSSRKEIWENSIKYKLDVELMVETRMGAEGGRVYTIEPSLPRQVDGYDKTLYSDEEAERNACTATAIAPTVATLAGMAVFSMINYVRGKQIYNETIMSMSPVLVLNKNFT